MKWSRLGKALWDAFRAMSRPPSMSGVAEISNQEILAYQQIEGIQFNAWELGVIRMFDAIAMDAMHHQQSKTA